MGLMQAEYGREIASGAEQTGTAGLFKQLAVLEGSYEASSLIAEAQRCVNLYMEINPEDAPFPTTHYPTPGLTSFAPTPSSAQGRGIYRATNGGCYAAIGDAFYLLSSAGAWTQIAALATNTGRVGMADNGTVLVAVDGTQYLYVVQLSDHSFVQVNQPDVYGATHVGYVDTYFVFNRPGTNQFYISASNLDFSSASEGPLNAVSITTGGSSYYDKTSTSVPLTGGTGSGAEATLVVSGGAVTTLTLTQKGSGYKVGDVLSADLSSDGPVTGVGIGIKGQYLVDGTYSAQATSGGEGTGLTLNVTVSGGVATAASVAAGGSSYLVGDIVRLSPDIPGAAPPRGDPVVQPYFRISSVGGTAGSGFTATVGSIYNTASVNPLDVAAKTGYPDVIKALICLHREVWLFGERTTEVWYDTGAPDFTFGIMDGVFIQYGIVAPYSLAKTDVIPFWLGQDFQGRACVLMAVGYHAQRISTHAIEKAIQSYAVIDDAIGFTYQQRGHVFYVLNFPTADKTWVYDLASGKWHERVSLDSNGVEHRHPPIDYVNCFGKDLVLDYATGAVYYYDLESFDDLGAQVPRIRSFAHLKNQQRRVVYVDFVADIETGNAGGTIDSTAPQVYLRWSNDGGFTWGNRVPRSLGAAGEYSRYVRWNRLGYGRDRIYELSWSADVQTALNGGWMDVEPCET